jgi:hypothetical protein
LGVPRVNDDKAIQQGLAHFPRHTSDSVRATLRFKIELSFEQALRVLSFPEG